jgi:hypothetical protein
VRLGDLLFFYHPRLQGEIGQSDISFSAPSLEDHIAMCMSQGCGKELQHEDPKYNY